MTTESGHSTTIYVGDEILGWDIATNYLKPTGETTELNVSYVLPDQDISFPVTYTSTHPHNAFARLLVLVYETCFGVRCPGSWKTKRLRKKRWSALQRIIERE